MFKSNKPLRKINIKERPKSSAFKIFKQHNMKPTSMYHSDFKSCDITPGQFGPSHPLKKSILWKPALLPSAQYQSSVDDPNHLPPINKQNLASIYQEDYRTMKNHFNSHQKDSPLVFTTFKEGSVKSTTHDDYQLPPVIATSLKGPSTRYQCNKKMVFQAHGIVPSVNVDKPHEQIPTQYTSDYNSTIPSLPKLDTKEKISIVRNGNKVLKLKPDCADWIPPFADNSDLTIWRYS